MEIVNEDRAARIKAKAKEEAKAMVVAAGLEETPGLIIENKEAESIEVALKAEVEVLKAKNDELVKINASLLEQLEAKEVVPDTAPEEVPEPETEAAGEEVPDTAPEEVPEPETEAAGEAVPEKVKRS